MGASDATLSENGAFRCRSRRAIPGRASDVTSNLRRANRFQAASQRTQGPSERVEHVFDERPLALAAVSLREGLPRRSARKVSIDTTRLNRPSCPSDVCRRQGSRGTGACVRVRPTASGGRVQSSERYRWVDTASPGNGEAVSGAAFVSPPNFNDRCTSHRRHTDQYRQWCSTAASRLSAKVHLAAPTDRNRYIPAARGATKTCCQ